MKMNETKKLVEDVFPQGDVRYGDSYAEELVASFIDRKGIQIEKRIIIDTKATKKELASVNGPQQLPKLIATRILIKEGYNLIGYERKFMGGIADTLATSKLGDETIAIECYSCRTMKAIDYLEEENTTLWIISAATEEEFLSNTLSLYIIKRGPNWKTCIEEYRKEKMRRCREVMDSFNEKVSTKTLKGIKSPLERLYEKGK